MSHFHPTTKQHTKAAVDRTPFYGYRVPHEVKEMCRVLKGAGQASFRKVLLAAMNSIEGKPVSRGDLKTVENEQLTLEAIGILFSGVLKVLQLALRCSESALGAEALKEDLVALGIQREFVDDLAVAVFGPRRASVIAHINQSRPSLPSLKLLKWRVDVGISTSVLNRVLEPSVLLELELSDGTRRTLEVPISKFHELRYNTAFVLKEVEDLEKRSILKIQD